MLELIFKAAGHEPFKAQVLPGFMLEILALFVPIMRELAEMNYQWAHDYVFEAPAFTKAFGADHVTTHAVAVEKTLAWFRANLKP